MVLILERQQSKIRVDSRTMRTVLALMLALLMACQPSPPPLIISFTATPSVVPFGGAEVTLNWDVQGADSINIEPGIGIVMGSSSKTNVTKETTFILTASNSTGAIAKALTVTVAPAPRPVISSFTATPQNLPSQGGKVKLEWVTTNTSSLSITPDVGDVNGKLSIEVDVTSSTTFALNASGPGGITEKTVGVFVADKPPAISSFIAAPNTLAFGGGLVTLNWDVIGADTFEIDQGIGSVTGTSITTDVQQTKTFKLSASNSGGTVTREVTISVSTDATALSSRAIGLVDLNWDTNNRAAVTDSSGTLKFSPLTYSDIDYIAGGMRYLTATFEVFNLGSSPIKNATVRAIARAGNLGETAAFDVRAFPNADNPEGELFTDSTVAQRIVPLHGVQLLGSAPITDSQGSDFQAYRATESAQLESASSSVLQPTDRVLDYGFVIKRCNATCQPNDVTRDLRPGERGILSIAMRLPRSFTPLPKVYRFKLSFLVTEDDAPRVSRSLLETVDTLKARALPLATQRRPTQAVLIGADADTITDALIAPIRLPNVRIGLATSLPTL